MEIKVTQVSNVLAHELRQPLSAIKCYAHGLTRSVENRATSAEKVIEILGIMEQKADFAEEMIRKIRSFARRGTHRERVKLKNVVAAATENFLLGSQNTDQIVLKVDEEAELFADPFEVELVLVNLLRNASEKLADCEHPTIWITGSRTDGGIDLVVEDNGKVVSQEEVLRISDHIRRTEFVPDERGRGVGLLIVREVIESLNGTIDFERRSPRGLIVRIFLPSDLNNEQELDRG